MVNIDLNQILVFVKVVQTGSMTKAAEALKQPKSRISRRLAALEKSLGTQLVYRTTRQMQLTESGRAYYQRCGPLIESLENANVGISTQSEELIGVLRVTAPEDYGKRILAPLIDEFIKRHPKLRIEVILSGTYLDLVKESIDVAIRVGHLKDASMRSKKITSVTSILVASPTLLEKYKAIVRPEQLSKIPCLTFQGGLRATWKLIKEGSEQKVKVEGPVSANAPDFIYHMALLGRGVGLVPAFLCQEALNDGTLVQILKGWTSEPTPIQLLSPAQKEVPPKTKAFIEFVSQRVQS
ncbi:MAG: LysR family transcriptional regulator [Proteobacteria bacterium]|nr:MAG: LysR family transcriptional regulator [Pseudomonadota bacterium]